jgi:hypothetical protein
MKEAFQDIVLCLALWGLAASTAMLALRSWPVRAAFARLAALWRGMPSLGRAAACAFLLVGILVGGEKRTENGKWKMENEGGERSGNVFNFQFSNFNLPVRLPDACDVGDGFGDCRCGRD